MEGKPTCHVLKDVNKPVNERCLALLEWLLNASKWRPCEGILAMRTMWTMKR